MGESVVTNGLKVTSSSTKFLELLIRSAIAILFAIVRGVKTAALIIVYFFVIISFWYCKVTTDYESLKILSVFSLSVVWTVKGMLDKRNKTLKKVSKVLYFTLHSKMPAERLAGSFTSNFKAFVHTRFRLTVQGLPAMIG